LNNEVINQIDEFRYLGVQINKNCNPTTHLKKRLSLAKAAVAKSFNNDKFLMSELSGQIKIQNYKTFVRTVMLFNVEIYELNPAEIDQMRAEEMKLFKQCLNIQPRTRNKLLLDASKMISLFDKYSLMKSSLVVRLLQNEYTGTFLNELKANYEKTIPKKSILNHLIFEESNLNIETSITKQKIKIKNITQKFEQGVKSERSKELRELLRENITNSEKIFELIRAF
jgi:hypothetical protein